MPSPFFKSKSSPPLRIADVLLLQEHQEEALLPMDGRRRLSCSTPRRIAARFFSALKHGKVKGIVAGDREEEGDDDVPPPATDCPDSSSERCRREANLNVGIGCCLLRLIAESKNELQTMTELRMQMESVLQNVKEELRNNDLLAPKKLESNDGGEEGSSFNSNLRLNDVLFDQYWTCDDVPKQEDCLEGMDRLEAELQIELERLQLHLDTGKLSINPPQETAKESTVNSTISARSYSISSGEVIDPTMDGEEEEEEEEEDCYDSYSGSCVPPHELERKLHELLETRQEQQIRELEAALENTRQELIEKEREISWWKETAHLMLRHVKASSRLDFQHGHHTQPF